MPDADTLRAGIKFHAANIEALRARVEELEGKIQENREIITAAYGELLGIDPDVLELHEQGHACPPTLDKFEQKHKATVKRYEGIWTPEELNRIRTENPLGACVYNSKEDPSLDFCLFCGHPDERK